MPDTNKKKYFEQRAEAMYPLDGADVPLLSVTFHEVQKAKRAAYIKGLQENVGGLVEALEKMTNLSHYGSRDAAISDVVKIATEALASFANTNSLSND